MDRFGEKETLVRYLDVGRDALLWKLDGLSEYDVRRPLVPTGTNLLGLVTHVTLVESGYFGAVFGRPYPVVLPGSSPDEVNADMWVPADVSRDAVLERFADVRAHADATISALALDDTGEVPWWPEEVRAVSLHRILVHVATEVHRHAGHADIVRELIDGTVGLRPSGSNLPNEDDADWWRAHHDEIERHARVAGGIG